MAAGLVALLAGCASTAATISASPRSLVLRLSQLPYPGFTSESGPSYTGVISNKRAAGGSAHRLAAYLAAGREGGYLASFQRQVSPQQAVGPIVIQSSAARFAGASGAGKGLQLLAAQAKSSGYRAISTGHLGQEVRGFFSQRTASGTEYESYLVVWRQANVVNEVQAEGNAATMDLTYALDLARLQQDNEVTP
ncbi:MAG: hypothetical protein ACREN7_09710 [Candidatus Dormibacteria bacterium]